MDIQEINANSLNVTESILHFQMFVLEKEVAIFSIIALASQGTLVFNANSLNVIKSILQIPVFVQDMDLVVP
jgi:hypothetical protein